MKKRVLSEETKKKISEARKGKPSPFKGKHHSILSKSKIGIFHKGKIGWNRGKKGRKASLETKQKMSLSHKGKKIHSEVYKQKLKEQWSGKNNPAWNGGRSFGEYGIEYTATLKKFIINRDIKTCQICNNPYSQDKLVVHHIDYNKKNNNVNNLVCLCRTCHPKTNYNRDRWILYFSEKRKYLPSFSDLIDRLCISQMKEIFIHEHAEEYRKESSDISNDIDILIREKNIKLNAKITWAIIVIQLANRVIWENESKARAGGMDQDKLLKFTHSINGIRNTAKNIISQELGERVDLKIDCLATELPKELGNWDIFKKIIEYKTER